MKEAWEIRLEELKKILSGYLNEGICIAYSGGVDSSLLLKAAVQTAGENQRVKGVIFDTYLHPAGEIERARETAMRWGAEVSVIRVNEMDNPKILDNPTDRCYWCKRYLYEHLLQFAGENGCKYVLDGNNADDEGKYRPGMRAVKELGVISPLAALGITKEQVRSMAKALGVEAAAKPSDSCLATRLPYGTRLELQLLEQIREAERILHELGFSQVRVRVHGEIARIEIEKNEFEKMFCLREQVVNRLKGKGFRYLTFDLEGFRSGSMDGD